jgi:hypothetical protein
LREAVTHAVDQVCTTLLTARLTLLSCLRMVLHALVDIQRALELHRRASIQPPISSATTTTHTSLSKNTTTQLTSRSVFLIMPSEPRFYAEVYLTPTVRCWLILLGHDPPQRFRLRSPRRAAHRDPPPNLTSCTNISFLIVLRYPPHRLGLEERALHSDRYVQFFFEVCICYGILPTRFPQGRSSFLWTVRFDSILIMGYSILQNFTGSKLEWYRTFMRLQIFFFPARTVKVVTRYSTSAVLRFHIEDCRSIPCGCSRLEIWVYSLFLHLIGVCERMHRSYECAWNRQMELFGCGVGNTGDIVKVLERIAATEKLSVHNMAVSVVEHTLVLRQWVHHVTVK